MEDKWKRANIPQHNLWPAEDLRLLFRSFKTKMGSFCLISGLVASYIEHYCGWFSGNTSHTHRTGNQMGTKYWTFIWSSYDQSELRQIMRVSSDTDAGYFFFSTVSCDFILFMCRKNNQIHIRVFGNQRG